MPPSSLPTTSAGMSFCTSLNTPHDVLFRNDEKGETDRKTHDDIKAIPQLSLCWSVQEHPTGAQGPRRYQCSPVWRPRKSLSSWSMSRRLLTGLFSPQDRELLLLVWFLCAEKSAHKWVNLGSSCAGWRGGLPHLTRWTSTGGGGLGDIPNPSTGLPEYQWYMERTGRRRCLSSRNTSISGTLVPGLPGMFSLKSLKICRKTFIND